MRPLRAAIVLVVFLLAAAGGNAAAGMGRMETCTGEVLGWLLGDETPMSSTCVQTGG